MGKTFVSRILAATVCAMAVLSSCEVHHFITDTAYRKQVEDDLRSRMEELSPLTLDIDYGNRSITCNYGYVKDCYLTTAELEALEFLYAYMPLADLTGYPADYFLQNVRASFKAREEMGWNVPERIFRHFVLPIRVNNENLDTSRVAFYRELKPRLEGLQMQDAILEVNHWCHEKLTYRPSDARTLSPLSCARSTFGRCGEEATFTVAALRAVGIPARQVYTPRWAHTDDNHAWVEAWADGNWYFMGACEPEPVLNLGWFNAPASRAMLMHTRVFGKYDGPEEKVMEGSNFTEINLIDNYAETARVDFEVVDEAGNPVDGALVDFMIYNYAEFYPALSKYTLPDGKTFLTAGKGDMLCWASKDGKYGYSKVSFGTDKEVRIIISDSHPSEPQALAIVPPPEKAVLPEVTEDQRKANNIRLAQEDLVRKTYMATFIQPDGTVVNDLLAKAAGNHEVISAFLGRHQGEDHAKALELLRSLSDKDLVDITDEILEDNMSVTSASGIPPVLCPRVENEFLTPYKSFFTTTAFLAEEQKELSDPQKLIEWVRDSIRLTGSTKAWRIAMSPAGVYEARTADPRSRDIFFVSLARTLGIDARKDPVTGKVQYKESGVWTDVDFGNASQSVAPAGKLILKYSPTGILQDPGYYTHFTISKIVDGRTQLLTFDEGQVDMGGGVSWNSVFKNGTSLDVGDYLLVSGNRLSDGSVPVTMQQFTVKEGETTVLDLIVTIPEDKLPVIGEFDSETRYFRVQGTEPVSILSTTGRGNFVVCFLTPRHEPSVHAINDIAAAREALENWGRPILLLSTPDGLDWMKEYSEKLPSTVRFGIAPRKEMDGHVMPRILLADTFNRVFFSSEGYSIGLGDQLASAIAKLQ